MTWQKEKRNGGGESGRAGGIKGRKGGIKVVKKHIHMVKTENIYSYICFWNCKKKIIWFYIFL